MERFVFNKGAASVSIQISIKRSDTGQGLTGLAFNTASLVASYARSRTARAAITLATQTVTGAYSSGGFVEIDATNMPGEYRLDIPDAALATGVDGVTILLKGAANMLDKKVQIELVDVIDSSNPILANLIQINSSAALASKFYDGVGSIEQGQAVTGTLSTTQMSTNLAEATDNHYLDRTIIWTSGPLLRQAARITGYNGTTKVLTFSQVTDVPANGNTFIIV